MNLKNLVFGILLGVVCLLVTGAPNAAAEIQRQFLECADSSSIADMAFTPCTGRAWRHRPGEPDATQER